MSNFLNFRRTGAFMCAVVLIALLTACGAGKYAKSAYTGVWHPSVVTREETQFVASEILGFLEIELKADGSCSVTGTGAEETDNTWQETENGIKIVHAGGTEEFLTAEGDALVYDGEGVRITFLKESADAESAAGTADVESADFAGVENAAGSAAVEDADSAEVASTAGSADAEDTDSSGTEEGASQTSDVEGAS